MSDNNVARLDPELQRLSDTEVALRSALDHAMIAPAGSINAAEITWLQTAWGRAVDELCDAIGARQEPHPDDRA